MHTASLKPAASFGGWTQKGRQQILVRHRGCREAGCLLLVSFSLLTPGATSSPELQSIEPRALQPGGTHRVTLHGKNLALAHGLWTSWLGDVEKVDAQPWEASDETLKVPILVPSTVPCGIEVLRLVGTNGVSAPIFILIDNLPVAPTPSGNFSIHDATALTPPIAVDATCAESRLQYYRLALDQGERVSLEIVANRLGSATDPVMRVLDVDGRELSYLNDSPGIGSDCALDFYAPTTGIYFVEVRDAEYAGGEANPYRLRIGHFPVGVLSGVPAIAPWQTIDVPWESTVGPWTGVASAMPPAWGASATGRLRFADDALAQALAPRLSVSENPLEHEIEPNASAAAAQPLIPAVAVLGRFEQAGDQDWFRIDVPAAASWRFEVRSRSLGLPCDPVLRLMSAAGATLATANGGNWDPVMNHHFDSAGQYFLVCEEAAGRFGAGRAYVIRADRFGPGFALSTEVEHLNVPAGGREVLKITIDRQGYDGPMRLEGSGFITSLSFENPIITSGKKEWELGLRCDEGVVPGAWCIATITARPLEAGPWGSSVLDLRPAFRKVFPRVLAMPPGYDDGLWLAIVPATEKETPASVGSTGSGH